MIEEQKITIIPYNELLNAVTTYKKENCRIVQICATRTEGGYEITYSFAKDYDFEAVRILIDEDTEIFSISSIYAPAFLYENEMKDLFGVKIKQISIDYNGNFYRIDEKQPYK